MLGVFFALLVMRSTEAKADFLSSILGDEASAQTEPSQPDCNYSNSNCALLPTFYPTLISKDKNSKDDKVDESANILVSDNALIPTTSPQTAFGGIDNGDFSFDQISIYEVKPGDTLAQVADMFGVSTDTILSANDMKKGDKLKEGDILLILPFSGIEHTVLKGQTLQNIANLYKVDVNEILFANDIDIDTKLAVGEKLIIPGVDMLNEATPKTKSKSTIKGSGSSYASMPSTTGYFKNPVSGAIRTRGIKPGHRGVDFAAPTGTPIHAAASGTVLIARNSGYNGGFGKYVVIKHPNGTKTLYAHMSRVSTSPGAQVSQGETIGYIGSTGRSTGPHLHIEVLGGKNPF